jgi:hypothetical protein
MRQEAAPKRRLPVRSGYARRAPVNIVNHRQPDYEPGPATSGFRNRQNMKPMIKGQKNHRRISTVSTTSLLP